jgi:hypothetical protein
VDLDRSPIRNQRTRRREALREIREELERVRRSEARVAEALGSLRAARHRVEELVRSIAVEDDAVRDIVREEVAAAVDGSTPADESRAPRVRAGAGLPVGSRTGLITVPEEDGDGTDDANDPARAVRVEDESSFGLDKARAIRLVAVAVASVLVVAMVGWLGVRALRDEPPTPAITLGGDTSPATLSQGATADAREVEEQSNSPSRFFLMLPEDASQRAAVYDSLWDARSPLFEPLLVHLERATSDRAVNEALEAWRAASLTPLQSDLLHSALVQYALTQETGADLTVDGQLLRNPCRGTSCSALLNFWETRKDSLGLPPVPEDAPTDPAALRVAENVLVLGALEEAHQRSTNGG